MCTAAECPDHPPAVHQGLPDLRPSRKVDNAMLNACVCPICRWAVKLASDAVTTVLKVDQIIMSKQAGGPKMRGPGGDDD
jgi:hypothetical protein